MCQIKFRATKVLLVDIFLILSLTLAFMFQKKTNVIFVKSSNLWVKKKWYQKNQKLNMIITKMIKKIQRKKGMLRGIQIMLLFVLICKM